MLRSSVSALCSADMPVLARVQTRRGWAYRRSIVKQKIGPPKTEASRKSIPLNRELLLQ